MGAVSTYNPYRGGKEEGGPQTASGELYDPLAWTAAIKTELRNRFRGVRYGRLYQPTFALVQSGDKQLIVKINDVGPLRPGRVLDLNERSMRHFDPFLTKGHSGRQNYALAGRRLDARSGWSCLRHRSPQSWMAHCVGAL
jgi:rare lipoprotein A